MSLSDLDTKKIYQGNGSTTTFAITFDYTDAAEVVVILRDETSSTIVETTQALTTNYTIVGANISMVTAPTATQKLVVKRTNPKTQSLDLIGTGELQVESLEESLDKLTRLIQEVGEQLSRSAKLPITFPNEGASGISDLVLPEPVANAHLGWNSGATAIENKTVSSSAISSPLTTKGDLITFDTAAARLGIGSNGYVLQADSAQAKGMKWSPLSFPHSKWSAEAGGPAETIENNMPVFLFADAITQNIVMVARVPAWYVAGRQISLKCHTYSPSASGSNKVASTTTLLRPGTTAATSTANQNASTNGVVTLALANRVEVHTLDLTDSNGAINSVAVAVGDLLLIEVNRDHATDADTAEVRFIKDTTEVTIA